jgi:hypothetical protein
MDRERSVSEDGLRREAQGEKGGGGGNPNLNLQAPFLPGFVLRADGREHTRKEGEWRRGDIPQKRKWDVM